ncbi:hypothetical protein O181_093852 [Austropuccinia psidii MF-1]|uniref:GAG-pre-integrase domain-containing protein n=1 Tax=Austropuccinia psidii MF-1 TaxID=1389203 RepID=A0A9Q3PAW9_9BASI|nr:hypothetical protein [Austropuccinia psidii MF-1]
MFPENLYPDHQTNVDTGRNKSFLTSQGRGLAKLYDWLENLLLFPKSLYIHDLTTNLPSLSTIAKNETQMKRTIQIFETYLENNDKSSFVFPISSGVLETQINISTSHFLNTQEKDSGDLWHKKLGHMKKVDINKLINTTEFINVGNESIKGKIIQLNFKHSFKTTDHVLENVQLDLCGPFQIQSLSGATYFGIIIDQMSGFLTTKYIRNKSDYFNKFPNIRLLAEIIHSK